MGVDVRAHGADSGTPAPVDVNVGEALSVAGAVVFGDEPVVSAGRVCGGRELVCVECRGVMVAGHAKGLGRGFGVAFMWSDPEAGVVVGSTRGEGSTGEL